MLIACDRDGPAAVRVLGFALGELYAVLLEQVLDPERIALLWSMNGCGDEAAVAFTYVAGLDPDGRWRISASAPDFRRVLGTADDVDGWLQWVVGADRPALRSRNLQLLQGTHHTGRYTLDLPDGRGACLHDSARPVHHPLTQEVIGLFGRVEIMRGLALDSEAIERNEPIYFGSPSLRANSELEQLCRGLELARISALLLDLDAIILHCTAAAGRTLGDIPESLMGRSAVGVLFESAETASNKLEQVFSTTAEDNEPFMRLELQGSAEAAAPSRMKLKPLALDGDRQILVCLEGEESFDEGLQHARYFDGATGLPSRFLCLDRLHQNIARSADGGSSLAVLVLEIDRWSLIDSSFGRTVAESAIAEISRRIVATIGGLDTAARLADSRLAVIAGNLAGPDDAARTAEALLDRLREPVIVGGREIEVGGSIGIAVFPEDGDCAETLIAHAEAALHRKSGVKEPDYRFYTSAMNTAFSDRQLFEQQLLDAVERGEFLLLYQPQISFASSRIVGMEALIRWRHPELGMVPPAEFVPLAEETGAIGAIGEWVLETACRELHDWFAAGVAPLRLAINISGRQYNDPNLVASIRRTLEDTDFPPHLLELELTESVIMEDVVDATRRLGDLHALGINLAVDDFGTGYSSLSYLKRFPIRSLKVDRSFVRDIAHNEAGAAVARAIIAFGSALGLKVIAEGVESHDQYEILRGCGCDELQGYLFSRPVPADDARKLASGRRHLPLVRA
jgi:diguanylate cyclase (GGDEF)-like protein